jgi:hypothetical protein
MNSFKKELTHFFDMIEAVPQNKKYCNTIYTYFSFSFTIVTVFYIKPEVGNYVTCF